MLLPLRDDNPIRHIGRAYVMLAILAANIAVFAYQLSLPAGLSQRFVLAYGAIPADLFGLAERAPEIAAIPSALTLISSMFLHGGLLHIAGNMLFLWVLGDNVEDSMGHLRFVAFYLLCGIVAALSHAALAPNSTIPMIGASGAISGVIGAYLVLHPRARINTLVLRFVVPLPAWLVLGLWIAFQIFNAASASADAAGVAWWAHIGGFVAGAMLIAFFRHRDVPLFDGGRRRVVIPRSIIPRSGRRP